MYKYFSETIKLKLREKNKSLRELCREAGVDASFLSKVLKNKRNPPSDEKILHKIAASLGVNPVKLVIYTGKVPEKYYDLFCSDKFIDWVAGGASVTERKPQASEKKHIPAEKVRHKRTEMLDELL